MRCNHGEAPQTWRQQQHAKRDNDPTSRCDRGVGSDGPVSLYESFGINLSHRSGQNTGESPRGGIIGQLIQLEEDRLAELREDLKQTQSKISQTEQRLAAFLEIAKLNSTDDSTGTLVLVQAEDS